MILSQVDGKKVSGLKEMNAAYKASRVCFRFDSKVDLDFNKEDAKRVQS